jgi:hypothetical protein
MAMTEPSAMTMSESDIDCMTGNDVPACVSLIEANLHEHDMTLQVLWSITPLNLPDCEYIIDIPSAPKDWDDVPEHPHVDYANCDVRQAKEVAFMQLLRKACRCSRMWRDSRYSHVETFTITSVKGTEQFIGTRTEAIDRAAWHDLELRPAFGTQLENEAGDTVWDSRDDEDD